VGPPLCCRRFPSCVLRDVCLFAFLRKTVENQVQSDRGPALGRHLLHKLLVLLGLVCPGDGAQGNAEPIPPIDGNHRQGEVDQFLFAEVNTGSFVNVIRHMIIGQPIFKSPAAEISL